MRIYPLLQAFMLVAAALLLPRAACAEAPPSIAAAADLRIALVEIADMFRRDTGQEVKLIFGSSGNVYRQLQQGAPFQMFLSADEGYVLDLARTGLAQDSGRLYAVGRLALVAPHGSRLLAGKGLVGLRRALDAGTLRHFAIANPAHAPYGKRAEEALRHAGLHQALRPRLVLGENVSQAMQFVSAGAAEGGLVAYSLALDPALKGHIGHVLIPAAWHSPLRQRMVLMKGAGNTATRFFAFMQQPAARLVLARNGFTLPTGRR